MPAEPQRAGIERVRKSGGEYLGVQNNNYLKKNHPNSIFFFGKYEVSLFFGGEILPMPTYGDSVEQCLSTQVSQ